MPSFQNKSLSSIAYYDDLYTDFINGRQNDDVERWIEKEYESPAKPVFDKIYRGTKLSKSDYLVLKKFAMMQFVRTPTFFKRNIDRWQNEMKDIMENIQIPRSIEEDFENSNTKLDGAEHLTLKVNTVSSDELSRKRLVMEASIGRGFWLFSIKQIMLNTMSKIPDHKWTIMQAPPNFCWPLSDNPVCALNYHNADEYDFGGGWNFEGSEIFMPITPEHLLYTQIGRKNGSYINVSRKMALDIRRLLIENADEFLILTHDDSEILNIRKRIVDPQMYQISKELWQNWSETQKNIDNDYSKFRD